MSEVVTRFGRLDILVNNAGGWKGGAILELAREDWDAVIGTHLTGSFLCARHAAKAMILQKTGGKIINIASMFSIFGVNGGANYVAAKTGILGLTRALAIELAEHNVQVNAISPGYHWTPLTQGMKGTARAEQIRRKTPAGRWGNADDIVGATIFLAASTSDYVTGTSIAVDGGYSITEQFKDEE